MKRALELSGQTDRATNSINIMEDIGEQRNPKDERPEQANDLLTLLENWHRLILEDFGN